MNKEIKLLDCTLRDGGYYNAWNFDAQLVNDYLQAMLALEVSYVEIGLRSLINKGFKGGCAFTTESFIGSLNVPKAINLGVMVNASELISQSDLDATLEYLFPVAAANSHIQLVRVACHPSEFRKALPVCSWLKNKGYQVGFNIMQIADCSQNEVEALAQSASEYPLDVLYFADSMGSMTPEDCVQIITWLRKFWSGPLGVHTHDNMGLALQNCLGSIDNGVTWIDATVTGMGRGPGNVKTEYLVLELADRKGTQPNITQLMGVIRRYFEPMQKQCGWGTNTFYYLAGKYGIHPTYIQEMIGDSRYDEEDILAAIEHLRIEGGKKFNANTLDATRHFYEGKPRGSWKPSEAIEGKDVLILGSGPGVSDHKDILEAYIIKARPFVMALNTQSMIDASLIDARVACHPIRLLADCSEHTQLPQPLITPASMLPDDVQESLQSKKLLDFGLAVKKDTFQFKDNYCVLPSSLVIAYALAIANSGKASRILLAGFDGYGADDPRAAEMQVLLNSYSCLKDHVDITSVTPTRYTVPTLSIYAM